MSKMWYLYKLSKWIFLLKKSRNKRYLQFHCQIVSDLEVTMYIFAAQQLAPAPSNSAATMADLEAVLADVSYLMAMEKSKCTPAARNRGHSLAWNFGQYHIHNLFHFTSCFPDCNWWATPLQSQQENNPPRPECSLSHDQVSRENRGDQLWQNIQSETRIFII